VKPLLAVLIVLACATPVAAQDAVTPWRLVDYADDHAANWLAIAYGGLVGADIGISMSAFEQGAAREANPLLRPLQRHPVGFGFAKAAINTATVVAVYKWTRPRSATRYTALCGLIAVQAVVVGYNIRALREHR